jgi:hypothetical protein
MKLEEMEKLSDFYFKDLVDMLDDKAELIIPEQNPFGLNHKEVSEMDFEAIAQFGKIVKNYKRMNSLLLR